MLIDTHTHIYLEEFDADRNEVISRALEAGVGRMLLPNVDAATIEPMLSLRDEHPGLFEVMMGLHPTSVNGNYMKELDRVAGYLSRGEWCAVGEIGLDFYWDQTFRNQQLDALSQQLDWAMQLGLPVAVHSRSSNGELLKLLEHKQDGRLKGVLHCFSGTADEARIALELGFMLGFGGVITYKKSLLPAVVEDVPLERILTETDAPYLPPVPHRGRRNEPSFMVETVRKIAEIKQLDFKEVAEQTSANAIHLFNLQQN